MIKRSVADIQTPEGRPGFLGKGHIAKAIIDKDFTDSDPFILLMDDMLDKKDGSPVGGPHPHAGFETVSLLLEGEMGDDGHRMSTGDLQLMTAGGGIIHSETIDTKTSMRLLQLWLNLPKDKRWTQPRVQDIAAASVPQITGDGWSIKIYSGQLNGVASPVQNYASVIIADAIMNSGATTSQRIPSWFTTFIYVLEGSVIAGEKKTILQGGQVAWLDRSTERTESELELTAGIDGARFVIYAGEPQGDKIISHGPFIGDSSDDIVRLYREYREGKMQHISTVPATQRFAY